MCPTGFPIMNERWHKFFDGKYRQERDCLVWTKATDWHYGVAWFPQENRVTKAHRISFILEKGDIPPSRVPDHVCENKLCINPNHLELVTRLENTKRYHDRHGHYQHRITHCPRGHEYTPENTFSWRDGKRRCLTCEQIRRGKPLQIIEESVEEF